MMRPLYRFLSLLPFTLLVFGCSDDEGLRGDARQESGVGCLAQADCDESELCVKVNSSSSAGACFSRCVDAGDVCPGALSCTSVVDGTSSELACLPAASVTDRAWRSCSDERECEEDQRCIELDEAYGARCVPLCQGDENACADSAMACGVSVALDEGLVEGCAISCSPASPCAAGWACVVPADAEDGMGLCVR